MQTIRRIFFVVMLGVAFGQLAVAAEYDIDTERSELAVRLYKAGLGSAFAHNHVVHAADFEGTISWDPEEPSAASVTVTSDARSLVADDPAKRSVYELEKDLDDDKRQKIQKTMESKEQMAVEQFPEMSFVSRTVRAAGDGTIEVEGELQLHGRRNSVSFTTTPEVEDGVLRASAELEFNQTDFEIEPYSGMLGMVRNKDVARLIVHLVAVEQVAGSEAVTPPEGGEQETVEEQ